MWRRMSMCKHIQIYCRGTGIHHILLTEKINTTAKYEAATSLLVHLALHGPDKLNTYWTQLSKMASQWNPPFPLSDCCRVLLMPSRLISSWLAASKCHKIIACQSFCNIWLLDLGIFSLSRFWVSWVSSKDAAVQSATSLTCSNDVGDGPSHKTLQLPLFLPWMDQCTENGWLYNRIKPPVMACVLFSPWHKCAVASWWISDHENYNMEQRLEWNYRGWKAFTHCAETHYTGWGEGEKNPGPQE